MGLKEESNLICSLSLDTTTANATYCTRRVAAVPQVFDFVLNTLQLVGEQLNHFNDQNRIALG